MLKRDIQEILSELVATYQVVVITGPRQSGKTTLAKSFFSTYHYCNLEDPDTRMLALTDPRSFFRQYSPPLIIDEVQRVPQLFSHIQVMADELGQNGQFVLTGSQNLNLNQHIGQSLAGRAAIVTLLPFSVNELKQVEGMELQRDRLIYTGFLPRIHHHHQQPTIAYRNYLQTYVERDVRQLVNVRDLIVFEKFLRILAGRVGQLLNMSTLASDTGVSVTTIAHWISVLEASYIVFRVPPYFKNIGKRLIKSPKLYFVETGLAAYLLGIENEKQVARDPLLGHLFENMIVADVLKSRLNSGFDAGNIFFYRDSQHHEVDLLIKKGSNFIPVEIKAAETFHPEFEKNILQFRKIEANVNEAYLVYSGNYAFNTPDGTKVIPFDRLDEMVRG